MPSQEKLALPVPRTLPSVYRALDPGSFHGGDLWGGRAVWCGQAQLRHLGVGRRAHTPYGTRGTPRGWVPGHPGWSEPQFFLGAEERRVVIPVAQEEGRGRRASRSCVCVGGGGEMAFTLLPQRLFQSGVTHAGHPKQTPDIRPSPPTNLARPPRYFLWV